MKLQKIWNFKADVVPIIIFALGAFTKILENGQKTRCPCCNPIFAEGSPTWYLRYLRISLGVSEFR